MAAVGGEVAVLRSLGQLPSEHEPFGLETDVVHQGNYPHRFLNLHWEGVPAGEVECLQG